MRVNYKKVGSVAGVLPDDREAEGDGQERKHLLVYREPLQHIILVLNLR
ncbi:MAG: hypothetical protein Q9N34_03835 [Aquificota bacterium]|nr:hypothetical protein [Aquificota bacterium]